AGNDCCKDLLIELGQVEKRGQRKEERRHPRDARKECVADLLGRSCSHCAWCAPRTAAIDEACREWANQSWTAARILPRWTGGSPGRWCPVISSTTRSPWLTACSSARSIARQALSRFIPWRSTTRSGETSPVRSLRSQVESSVVPGLGGAAAGLESGRARRWTGRSVE